MVKINSTEYNSFLEAMMNVKSGDTLVLTDDTNEMLWIGYNDESKSIVPVEVTLDLNGHTMGFLHSNINEETGKLTHIGYWYKENVTDGVCLSTIKVAKGCKLTIIGEGEITMPVYVNPASDIHSTIINNGTLILKGNFKVSNQNKTQYTVVNRGKLMEIYDGVRFDNPDIATSAIIDNGFQMYYDKINTTPEENTEKYLHTNSEDTYWIPEINEEHPELIVYGGYFKGAGHGINVEQGSKCTIKDCVFDATKDCVKCVGDLIIEGGTFIEGTSGYAIITEYERAEESPKLLIKGGNISGKIKLTEHEEYTPQVEVTGGVFEGEGVLESFKSFIPEDIVIDETTGTVGTPVGDYSDDEFYNDLRVLMGLNYDVCKSIVESGDKNHIAWHLSKGVKMEPYYSRVKDKLNF